MLLLEDRRVSPKGLAFLLFTSTKNVGSRSGNDNLNKRI